MRGVRGAEDSSLSEGVSPPRDDDFFFFFDESDLDNSDLCSRGEVGSEVVVEPVSEVESELFSFLERSLLDGEATSAAVSELSVLSDFSRLLRREEERRDDFEDEAGEATASSEFSSLAGVSCARLSS